MTIPRPEIQQHRQPLADVDPEIFALLQKEERPALAHPQEERFSWGKPQKEERPKEG
jgi:hypothetical protein